MAGLLCFNTLDKNISTANIIVKKLIFLEMFYPKHKSFSTFNQTKRTFNAKLLLAKDGKLYHRNKKSFFHQTNVYPTSQHSRHFSSKSIDQNNTQAGKSLLNNKDSQSNKIADKIGFETSLNEIKDEYDADIKEKEIVMKVQDDGERRMKTDFSKIYTDNIFVPLTRAMPEYLLESSELDQLPKYTRRSPYPKRDNITVFKKNHLEQRAIDKWGSLENLQLQKDFLKARQDKLKKHNFSMAQEFYSYMDDREEPFSIEKPYLYQPKEDAIKQQETVFHKVSSAKVVLYAVACNSLNCLIKLVAWLYTGSHSMFAEVIHSAADTINQVILAVGIKQSLKAADSSHPYGWAKFRNVTSLISGVGIFCVGSGLSFYHGVTGLLYPTETCSLYWALITLGASAIFEGGTLMVALMELNRGRKTANMSLREYLTRGIDPTTTVILMEDTAAVMGIAIAGVAIGITELTGSGIPDAIGSLLIGTLLGSVASFIIYTNTAALVGKSIPAEKRLALVAELESDRMIRTLIDVKATEAGGKFVRFKAEVDFDGREVTRWYLEGIDMEKLYKDMKQVQSIEEAEQFMLLHGENVIDALGSAVDRIETNLKRKHPEIRHCDLEQL